MTVLLFVIFSSSSWLGLRVVWRWSLMLTFSFLYHQPIKTPSIVRWTVSPCRRTWSLDWLIFSGSRGWSSRPRCVYGSGFWQIRLQLRWGRRCQAEFQPLRTLVNQSSLILFFFSLCRLGGEVLSQRNLLHRSVNRLGVIEVGTLSGPFGYILTGRILLFSFNDSCQPWDLGRSWLVPYPLFWKQQ